MGLSMAERKAVTKQLVKRYRRAGKAEKGAILSELCELSGWSRDHARRALRHAHAPPPRKPRKPRAPIYTEETIDALRRIWSVFGFLCGKRLAPFMSEAVQTLERFGEISMSRAARRQLLVMSAATIDRRLRADRQRFQIKGRKGTKPGTLLRSQIPIRTFADWDEDLAGFCECDLVAHDGGSPHGDFAQTLTVTCVKTGWTEARALPNKAQRFTHEALVDIKDTLPFPLLGLDSDNGSEFINHQLAWWCEEQQITFTRTRPYRKNDNPFVEQKNWSVVRQAVGYHRYDTAAELGVLAELYGHLRLYVNFFQPSMKLKEKTRTGAKVTRRYDSATTPFRRVLACPEVSRSAKAALRRTYAELNPAELQRKMLACQTRLLALVKAKRRRPAPKPKRGGRPTPDHPWKRSYKRAFEVRQRKAPSRA